MITGLDSPWWPLFAAQVLSHGKPQGQYPLRLEHWLTWHFHFRVKGEGFIPAPAMPTDAIPEAT